MASSHHGGFNERVPTPELEALMKRFNEQVEKTAKREYPHGRISADDDGALAIAIKADHEHGTVVINFGKEVTWIGLRPKDVAQLIPVLIEKAREVATEPFTVSIPNS